MILFFKRMVLFILLTGSVACQRAVEDKASIVISLPPSEKLNALSCTTCLKFLAVNISGEGIGSTIYAKKEHGDFRELGTEITREIEIEVPVGKQRLFQLLAAYSSASGEIEIKYGTKTADLTSTTSQLSMTLSSLANFEGGQIAGRFLTGPDVGPTGTVNVNLIPVAGLRSFTLFKTNIINGWFDFFASKTFDVSYEFEGGMPLLSNIKLNEDFLPASLVTNTQVARIVRPRNYDRFNGMIWEPQTEDDTDLVIGYFFAPGYIDTNKKICKNNSSAILTRLSADGGTTYLSYDPLGFTGDVRVHGGDSTCGGSVSSQQYTQNVISLTAEQFNGMGNDTAKSLEGAFSYFIDGSQIKKYIRAANTFTVRFLPNTLNSIYDGAKLYRANSEPIDRDNIVCSPMNLSMNGFSEVPLSTSASTGNVYSITTTAALNSGYGLICPYKSGEIRGHGGMYLGSLATPGSPALLTISDGATFNYGTVANGAVVNRQFTISNNGGSNATGLGGAGLAAPFDFVGGPFPGTGGTCGVVLMPGGTCTVVVSFSPVAAVTSNDTFIISYNDSVAAQTTSRDVAGTGAAPAVLTITGNSSLTGIVAAASPVYELYTITNSGGLPATAMSGVFSGPFSFPGGSYPGTGGGTCVGTLAASASCLIRVEHTATTYSAVNGTIQLLYNNGNSGQTVTLAITGSGT